MAPPARVTRNSRLPYEAPRPLAHRTALSCTLLREGARHSWWHNVALNKRSAVPRHTEVNNRSRTKDLS